MIRKVIDLGFCIGRIVIENDIYKLFITSPSMCSGNVYEPAESITLYGEETLIALRDALNDALNEACQPEDES